MNNIASILIGCMRFSEKSVSQMNTFIHTAYDHGLNWFDHADIYGGGKSEEVFGRALAYDSSLRREDFIIQSKCGIRDGFYDLSKEHILSSVDGSLERLKTDYLDVLLLHRPDALVQPEEVAEAFRILETSGKVRAFGVSNHKPSQIELLKRYVSQPLEYNQLQLSLPAAGMIESGLEVNMNTPGAIDRDGSVLDYCRLNDITIQAWSPFQKPGWQGLFLESDDYEELNEELEAIAAEYDTTPTVIAAAWILRHPAGIQLIAGTTNEKRLLEIASAAQINLTRQDWYRLYLAAGHPLP